MPRVTRGSKKEKEEPKSLSSQKDIGVREVRTTGPLKKQSSVHSSIPTGIERPANGIFEDCGSSGLKQPQS